MELVNLTKRYAKLTVLDHFSLALPQTGIVAMLGPSGCGKTTLFNVLLGLVSLDGGEVHGRGDRVSCIFQEDRLLPWMSALENVELVASEAQKRRGMAAKLLERMGLGEALHSLPGELSGGMCRRVAIARGLLYDAPLLLMDEPFKGLDDDIKADIMELVAAQRDRRLSLMITHDQREAIALADEVCRMQGPPLTLQRRVVFPKDPRARAVKRRELLAKLP